MIEYNHRFGTGPGRDAAEMSHTLLKLAGGDRRSIGRADEVAADVLSDPTLFEVLIRGMWVNDPVIRMRAADAVEKVTRQHPSWLQPYKETLLDQVAAVDQQEVRWHLAQLIPRLALNETERRRAVALLTRWLDDQSKIVQVNAMQALVDLALADQRLRQQAIDLVRQKVETGSAAVRSRGRKLLLQLSSE